MTLKSFKLVKLSELPLQKLQDNTRAVLDTVTNKEILDGILLKGLPLVSGSTNEVNHKLGRQPQGWIIVRKRAQADVWDLQDLNTNPSATLSLACSSDVTIDIWVF